MSVNTDSAAYSTTTAGPYTWNGGACATCGARYTGYHTCSTEDILRRIGELHVMLARLQTCTRIQPQDRTAGCPCRPENGGSGICGCILGGPSVTC